MDLTIFELLQISRETVVSSNIRSIGYHKDTRTLVIEFKNKSIYSYSPITEQGFKDFRGADSYGQFFDQNIKYNTTLTYRKLRDKK